MLQKFEMVYTKEKDLLISQDGKLYDKKILLEKMDEFKTSRCPTISVIVYGDLQSNIHINPAGIFAVIKDMKIIEKKTKIIFEFDCKYTRETPVQMYIKENGIEEFNKIFKVYPILFAKHKNKGANQVREVQRILGIRVGLK